MKTNPLIGRTVHELYVSDGEQTLYFVTDKGIVTCETEGECCSETWFADILGVFYLLGHTVLAVVEDDGGDVDGDGRSRQEYDTAYKFVLTTELGLTDIIFRNSSNGYYGGAAEFLETDALPQNLSQITTDWSA